jgi:hypothetical protein
MSSSRCCSTRSLPDEVCGSSSCSLARSRPRCRPKHRPRCKPQREAGSPTRKPAAGCGIRIRRPTNRSSGPVLAPTAWRRNGAPPSSFRTTCRSRLMNAILGTSSSHIGASKTFRLGVQVRDSTSPAKRHMTCLTPLVMGLKACRTAGREPLAGNSSVIAPAEKKADNLAIHIAGIWRDISLQNVSRSFAWRHDGLLWQAPPRRNASSRALLRQSPIEQ